MSNPENYTVGWICALSAEFVAATIFFDEEHAGPEYLTYEDRNVYALGSMGKHNVVIAILPMGQYGFKSVERVAIDMIRNFPNIRISLSVGIGSGAPSQKHDIRLGDIVVSIPYNGQGSVLHYDFLKTIQNQSFYPTGLLDRPPLILRTAVNGLQAQYEIKGHQLEETVNRIVGKKPRLQKMFNRPEPGSDRLYRGHILHPAYDGSNCSLSCGEEPSCLILRDPRTEEGDRIRIHYGLVASTDSPLGDALIRDRLAGERDVLCFETEAVGLMEHFPCLVIRGICDYADSHKNKDWQGYAAIVAAAYAKDLLSRINPQRMESEERATDILRGGDYSTKNTFGNQNSGIQIGINYGSINANR
jgi:nucleoside phosphorylase